MSVANMQGLPADQLPVPVCFWLSPMQMASGPQAAPQAAFLPPQELPTGQSSVGAWFPVAVPMVCQVPLAGPQLAAFAAVPSPAPALQAASSDSNASTPPPTPAGPPESLTAPAVPLPSSARELLPGTIWRLSRDPAGSRLVQDALDQARDDEARLSLALELRGHVWEALQCPHANHVLQRCIIALRSQALQFILDELAGPRSSQAARHRYGCRILQRLFEHCRQDQLEDIVEELMASAVALSKHAYANFVMQHLLEYGTPEQRLQLVEVFETHIKALVKDEHGHAVLGKAMTSGSDEEQLRLARALLREGALLQRMARGRHGHVAVKAALQVLPGEEQERARQQLINCREKLRLSRYGRSVAAHLG